MKRVLAIALLASCSFTRVRGYREPIMNEPSLCTTSYRWPIVDGAITAIATGLTIYAVASHDPSEPASDVGGPPAALAGVTSLVALGFGISGLWGVVKVKTCREEMRR